MVAQVISGPIASGLLLTDGMGGLKGWQWLFLLEGLPTILLGVWVSSCGASAHHHKNLLCMHAPKEGHIKSGA